MNLRLFRLSGLLASVVFWTTTIVCGFLMPNYNHASNLVSELGALGTNTQSLFTIGLVSTSILSVLFVIGLLKVARQKSLNIIPILAILLLSFSLAGAALFPMPLALHRILGMPSILFPVVPLLSLLLWRKAGISGLKFFSFAIFVIMALGFSAFFPDLFEAYAGLKQRFFHAGWSLWFVYLATLFR